MDNTEREHLELCIETLLSGRIDRGVRLLQELANYHPDAEDKIEEDGVA